MLLLAWSIILLVLTVFSYTQVDLNLTLLNWQPYLDLQSKFTHLGYFNRPLNTTIFTLIFFIILVISLFIIYKISKKQISKKLFFQLIFLNALILLFDYTVFSHDLFNYLFDAKIITTYHLNPYLFKALDFPHDPWIRFMQWTHRTYPYGPFWLIISIIPSTLGFGKLIITLFLFKLIFASSYLVVCYYLYKTIYIISQNDNKSMLGTALFAFHPIVLIDSLISPHLDIVMIAISIYSFYILLNSQNNILKNKIYSILILFLSGLTKFATLLYLPSYLYFIISKPKNTNILIYSLIIISYLTVILQAYYSTHFQTWYLLLPLAYTPLLITKLNTKYFIIFYLSSSVPIIYYLKFLYLGNW